MDYDNYTGYEDTDASPTNRVTSNNNISTTPTGNGEKEKSITTYHVEFSKSNRSKCRSCKEIIDKEVARVGCTVMRIDEPFNNTC